MRKRLWSTYRNTLPKVGPRKAYLFGKNAPSITTFTSNRFWCDGKLRKALWLSPLFPVEGQFDILLYRVCWYCSWIQRHGRVLKERGYHLQTKFENPTLQHFVTHTMIPLPCQKHQVARPTNAVKVWMGDSDLRNSRGLDRKSQSH